MKVNLKLLKRLYLINRPTGKESGMISFILNYCYKIPKLTFETDESQNLFITKNTTDPSVYPCVVAHMDSVHDFHSERDLVMKGNVISAVYAKTNLICGLNADDSNGILVALQLLETLPNLKVVFTTGEEFGGTGAYVAAENLAFFADVSFLIQADRRGNSDLITYTNGLVTASPKFVEDISVLTTAYGYKPAKGTFTDIGVLAEALEISGVNVSCGYYHEHTDYENCNVRELSNCLNYIHDIIDTLSSNNTVYTIEVPKTKYSYYNNTTTPSSNQYSFGPSEELPCDTCLTGDCMRCKYFN